LTWIGQGGEVASPRTLYESDERGLRFRCYDVEPCSAEDGTSRRSSTVIRRCDHKGVAIKITVKADGNRLLYIGADVAPKKEAILKMHRASRWKTECRIEVLAITFLNNDGSSTEYSLYCDGGDDPTAIRPFQEISQYIAYLLQKKANGKIDTATS
jgi:hypothetical protein